MKKSGFDLFKGKFQKTEERNKFKFYPISHTKQ